MERWRLAAHREHASVDSAEPTPPHPARDGSIAEPHFHELGAGPNPMLAGGERDQVLIDR